jgi:toxin ParE1/3/4
LLTCIARDNPEKAAEFGYRLVFKVDFLAEFPGMGRRVPEHKRADVRELILRPYRIVYQVQENERIVAIARVWHAARGKPELD